MAGRDELLAAVKARLERMAATGDLSVTLEPSADVEARELGDILGTDLDLTARFHLGLLYWNRYLARLPEESAEDLNETVGMFLPCFVFGQGVDLAVFPPELAPVLADLAAPTAASWLAQAFGSADPALTSATAALSRRIADATPAGHQDRAARLNHLGTALFGYAMANGSSADLSAAIDAYKAAVAACLADDRNRAGYLGGLGNALRARFEQGGKMADLDEAVLACREAVELAHADDPNVAMCLSNLGIVLRIRSAITGDRADLDAAIGACRKAVEAAPPGDAALPGRLTNLANALLVRYDRTRDVADLNAAVEGAGSAVAPAPPGYGDLPAYLSNQAHALMTRFKVTETLADLDNAIEAWRAAAGNLSAGHPTRMMILDRPG